MGIVLHRFDLIDQARSGELLIQRYRREKRAPRAEVESVGRHSGDHTRGGAWSVPHRADVTSAAVEIDHIDATHVAHRHAVWQGIAWIVAFCVDHPERRVAMAGLL